MEPVLAPQGFRNSSRHQECRERVNQWLKDQVSPLFFRPCSHCGTLLLEGEKDFWCCGRGSRIHQPWPEPPPEFTLLMSENPRRFSKLSRVFNSLFCSAILHSDVGQPGINYHVRGGPPCMRVCGTLHASMMRTVQHCWLLSDCSFPIAYRSLSKNDKEVARKIAIILRKSNSAAEQIFNLNPTINVLHSSNEIREGSLHFGDHHDKATLCAVYVGPSTLPPRRLLICASLGSRHLLDESNPLWEVLLYPLFQIHGSTARTWREGLQPVISETTRRRKYLSLLEYLRSVMLYEKYFWKLSRLAHQFILDTWSRNEQMMAKVWRSETIQQKIRNVIRKTSAQDVPSDKIYLPPSVPGCVRYQQKFVQDAMYITSVLGNPHLFITMTANPAWPEVLSMLPPGQTVPDRPDVIARVFNQRRKHLLRLLKTPNFLFDGHLGIEFVISATEFQLCGLPHWHAAIRLKIDSRKVPMHTVYDQLILMDRLISARLPPVGTRDYDFVATLMMHNEPCDERCCRKRKDGTYGCRFYFPKEECTASRIDKKGFPVYRRGPGDSLVVPHNLTLLREMECHLDIEWTFGSSSIGYLYKYFSKHADSTGIKITDNADEIAAFCTARIITCNEGVYRAFNYSLNIRDPAVVLCRFSVPRRDTEPTDSDLAAAEAYLYGNPDELVADAPEGEGDENDERDLFGDLNDYFDRPSECEQMTFTQFFAEYYLQRDSTHVTFNMRQRMFPDLKNRYWIRRQNTRILARMPLVPLYVGEAYYLRALLLNQACRSYSDLYGGFATFQESAEASGYVLSPFQNINALLEAINDKVTSYDFRRLYVLMLYFCGDMVGTWQHDSIRKHLCQDFQPESRRGEDWDVHTAETLCTMHLVLIGQLMQREMIVALYAIPEPPESAEMLNSLITIAPAHSSMIHDFARLKGVDLGTMRRIPNHTGDIDRFYKIFPVPDSEVLANRIKSLKPEQRGIFDQIISCLTDNTAKCFHVDAPAGCGKTYLCQTILMYSRYKGMVSLACATTGIAAIHYIGGQTVHSFFKLPLHENPDVLEGDNFESTLLNVLRKKNGTGTNNRVELLRKASIIIWDEVCMAHKRMIHAVDKLMRKIMDKPLIPFGGKLIITLGDWRQVCPVQSDRDHILRRRDSEKAAYATSAFHTTILSSPLWSSFTVLSIKENVRQQHDTEFHSTLLRIGEGTLGPNVNLTDIGADSTTDFDFALRWLFETPPSDGVRPYDASYCHKRAFIIPFNSDVDTLNEWATERLSAMWGEKTTVMRAVDSEVSDSNSDTKQPERQQDHEAQQNVDAHIAHTEERLIQVEIGEVDDLPDFNPGEPSMGSFTVAIESQRLTADMYSPEVLKAQYFDGVPQSELHLIPGMVVMLLRNIDPSRRLMNGVRVEVVRVRKYVVIVRHIGDTNEHVIPRIKFDVTVGADKLHFSRLQVPLRLAYACTVHKSQASTMDRVVVDLRNGVFDHGQLYVALSRVRSRHDLLILVAPGQKDVLNIVHKIILSMGGVL